MITLTIALALSVLNDLIPFSLFYSEFEEMHGSGFCIGFSVFLIILTLCVIGFATGVVGIWFPILIILGYSAKLLFQGFTAIDLVIYILLLVGFFLFI